MKAFFHPAQDKHAPQSYLTRGQMRPPQELPERIPELVKGLETLGIKPEQATDHGMATINEVHDLGYLRFLESTHRHWPEDWDAEVMSNIFVRSPNPLRGTLAESARY